MRPSTALAGARRRVARAAKLAPLLLLLASSAGCGLAINKHIDEGMKAYREGRIGDAIPPLLKVSEQLDSVEPTDPRLPPVLDALGRLATGTGRPDVAEAFFRRAVRKAEGLDPPDAPTVQHALVALGLFYSSQRRFEEAIPLLTRARDMAETLPGDRLGYAIAIDDLGLAYAGMESWDEATHCSDESLAVLDAMPPSAEVDRTRAVVLFNRAGFLEAQGELEEAQARYEDALRLYERNPIPEADRWRMGAMLRTYGELLEKRGLHSEAARAAGRAEQYE